MSEYRSDQVSNWDIGGEFTACPSIPEAVLRLLRDRPTRAPHEGFGGLRMRTYNAHLHGLALSPAQIFTIWMDRFPATWPADNHFIPCAPALEPGVTAAILLSMPAGMRIITGARVVHRDETSLTLMTLLGHMFAGLITFSVFLEDNDPVIQTQALVSPGDPLFELAFLLGFGQRGEDAFWHAALVNAARLFGVQASVQQENLTISTKLQWRCFRNIWYNAAIRSIPHFYGRSLNTILKTSVIREAV